MKHISLLIVLLMLSMSTIGQPLGIHDMYIIPAEPTQEDDIKLVVHAVLPLFPCELVADETEVVIVDNDIKVITQYWTGFFTSFCSTVDTIELGYFSAGNYHLTCNYEFKVYTDTDSFTFTIGTPTNIGGHEPRINEINLFPNPTDGEAVQIVFTAKEAGVGDFSIHDLSGRMVYSTTETIVQGENYILLNYPEISSGMYIVSVGLADMRYSKKLIVK